MSTSVPRAPRARRPDHNFSRARAVERSVRVSLLRCESLTKTYGGRVTALSDLTVAVRAAARTAVLSSSGSASSSLSFAASSAVGEPPARRSSEISRLAIFRDAASAFALFSVRPLEGRLLAT